MDVMHLKNEFNVCIEADAEQDDARLHQELQQLIAEQFEDFDLGDDISDTQCVSNDEVSEENKLQLNSEEIASIHAAGKLSLLESAIQRFGDDDTQASEETLTDHLVINPSKAPVSFSSDLPANPPVCCGSTTNSCNSNLGQINNAKNSELPKSQPEAIDRNIAVVASTSIPNDNSRPLCFGGDSVSWEEGVENEPQRDMHLVMRFDRDAPTPYAEAAGLSVHRSESHGAPSVSETCTRSNSSTSCSSSIQRPFSELSTDAAIVSRTELRAPPTGNTIPSDAAFLKPSEYIPQWTVNELSISVSESYAQMITETDALRSKQDQNCDPTRLPLDPNERRELLYAARGRQVEELTAEISRLREEVAKEKRISIHRSTLAEGEREMLCAQLASSEQLILTLRKDLQANEEQINTLRQRLAESETSNSQLNKEILNLRSTNESLSTQLVELTSGNALRRAEEREDKLTEVLERRFAAVAEEAKEELATANRRLAEKEKEIAALQRQIDVYKSDMKKTQENFANSLRQATQQLEESQEHCQKLASSVLCSEVTTLRQKVSDFEMSKKISDDVNAILQDELRDLREQVANYECMLRLNDIPTDDDLSPRDHRVASKQHNLGDGKDEVPTCETFQFFEPHTTKARPSSVTEKGRVSYRGSEEYSTIHGEAPLDINRRKARFAHSNPSLVMESQPAVATNKESDSDAFHSLTRQGILTSTPAPAGNSMARLRAELERCLANYKAKRDQLTKLREELFTTRCQLHRVTEAAQKADKNASALQDRVISLEREVASNRELAQTPGPRETALSGQLDRLKADYAKIEEELQNTRTRLQAALGAEARALEHEKMASERLAASAAEREAAVNRARAVCEAHYASMRRRLEIEWANERTSIERIAEERVQKFRQELNACQANLDQMTKFYHDAQLSTQQAVEAALHEAMQERENERIRFWREELPQHIESARRSWEQEWAEVRNEAVSQAVAKCEHAQHETYRSDSGCDTVSRLESQTKSTVHAETNTDRESFIEDGIQTDMQTLLALSVVHESSSNERGEFGGAELLGFHVLHKFMSNSELRALRVQLLETETLNMSSLDRCFHAFLKRRCKFYNEQSWRLISLSLNKLFDEFGLENIISANTDPSEDLSAVKRMLPRSSDMAFSWYEEPTRTDDPRVARRSSGILSDSELTGPQNEARLNNIGACSVRDRVFLRLRQLARALSRVHESLNNAQSDLRNLNQASASSNRIDTELYHSTLSKIKQEVFNYVHMCQTRAAQTLHSELARVHRHACRQFTTQLRRALYEARFSNETHSAESPISGARVIFPRKSVVHPSSTTTTSMPYGRELSESREQTENCAPKRTPIFDPIDGPPPSSFLRSPTTFESLLTMIDNVCASAEKTFKPDTDVSAHLFDQPGSGESDNRTVLPQLVDSGDPVRCSRLGAFSISSAHVADHCFTPTGDLKPAANRDSEGGFGVPRKIPARTKAKLAWIQVHPHRSVPTSPDRRTQYSEDVGTLPQIPTCTITTGPLENQFSFVPVSTTPRLNKPVPAPRGINSTPGESEPLFRSAPSSHSANFSNRMLSPGCSEVVKSRLVYTELYNLFEKFKTLQK